MVDYAHLNVGRKFMIIDGEECESRDGKYFSVESPIVRNLSIAELPCATLEDVNHSVESAHKAWGIWGKMKAADRRQIMLKIADELEKHTEEIAWLLAIETGNAMSTNSRPESLKAPDVFRFFGGLAQEMKGFTLPVGEGLFSYTRREPLGVVAAITPWNAPVATGCIKVAPALAMGNCVVIKAASTAPLAMLKVVEICNKHLPPGVLNMISGSGRVCGKALAEHPLVRHITFTGSTDVGRELMKVGAQRIVPATMELGGKSPQIVFPDVEITDKLMNTIAANAGLFRAGQVCVAGTRIFVHKDIEEKFLAAFCERLKTIKVGNPLDESTECGAIVDRQQFETVCGYIAEGIKEAGRQPIVGGLPVKPELLEGYYIEPTLFEHADNKWKISQEEIFGPVIVEIPWETEEEVIAMANDTKYGLSSYVYTNNIDKALKTANAIEAGAVQINGGAGALLSSPYGGYKESGIGREYDLESMVESFSQVKNVHVNLAH